MKKKVLCKLKMKNIIIGTVTKCCSWGLECLWVFGFVFWALFQREGNLGSEALSPRLLYPHYCRFENLFSTLGSQDI